MSNVIVNNPTSKNINDVNVTQQVKKQNNNYGVFTGGFLGGLGGCLFLSTINDSEPISKSNIFLEKIEALHDKFSKRGLESVFALGAISAIIGTGVLLGAGSVYVYQKISESSQKELDKNVVHDDVSSTSDKKDFQATC